MAPRDGRDSDIPTSRLKHGLHLTFACMCAGMQAGPSTNPQIGLIFCGFHVNPQKKSNMGSRMGLLAFLLGTNNLESERNHFERINYSCGKFFELT